MKAATLLATLKLARCQMDVENDPAQVRILGFPMAAQSFDEAIARLASWASERPCRTAHFCTAHLLVEGFERPAVRAALKKASMLATDGMPLVWICRTSGGRAERVAGPDVMPALVDRGRTLGLRHYFYGSTPAVLEGLVTSLRSRYPGVQVAGAYAPPFRAPDPSEVAADIARINASGADVLWVGLGAPKQDLWVERCREELDVGVALAVGAAFDFAAGGLRRAPQWAQKAGLEWLFRLIMEPRRLWKRYLATNTKFMLYFLSVRRRHRQRRRPQ